MHTRSLRQGFRRILLIVGWAFLLAPGLPSQGKTYKLFFSPEKGNVLKYEYQFDLKRIREVAGRKSDVFRNVSAVISAAVDEVDPQGNLWMALMFEALSMGPLSPQKEQSAPTQKSLGIPVRYLLSPVGKILDIKGLEELPEIPGFNTKADYDLMAILVQLPGRDVAIGDTWTGEWTWINQSATVSQTNAFTTTYTVTEEVPRNGLDCLKIETATKEKIQGRMVMGGRDAVLSADIDLKGEIFYAHKEGFLVEKSYVEDGGKLIMSKTGPQPTTITFTNFGKARYVLVSREVRDDQSGEALRPE